MIKFKITAERICEACNIMDYMLLQGGNSGAIIRVSPRFVLDDNGEYIVKVITDKDGDIERFENISDAVQKISGVTPKRLEKLIDEFKGAVKNIVNPPNEGGLSVP